MRRYGQLTDITGQPISRASSGSSAPPFQQRPRAIDRSLTCDSDLSGSSSGSEGEDLIPIGQFQDGLPSRKKTGATAISQHSAKPQSAHKPCHCQQCCLLCLYILAVMLWPAPWPVGASPFLLLAMHLCVYACLQCCFSLGCGLRVFLKCHNFGWEMCLLERTLRCGR